ncbi:MAG TPA: hypothetical protein VL550_06560 [Rhodocyclaceae bacterium]|nr:hypothetical protein [Rhodocyclaceae bacterium]
MKRVLLLVICVVSVSAWADKAPWYRWKAFNGGAVVCAQTMPPTEWRMVAGPYVDPECRKLERLQR